MTRLEMIEKISDNIAGGYSEIYVNGRRYIGDRIDREYVCVAKRIRIEFWNDEGMVLGGSLTNLMKESAFFAEVIK